MRQAAALQARQQPLSMFNTAHPTQLARVLEAPPLAPADHALSGGSSAAAACERASEQQHPPAAQQEGTASAAAGGCATGKDDNLSGSCADRSSARMQEHAARGEISIAQVVPLPHVVHRGDRHTT